MMNIREKIELQQPFINRDWQLVWEMNNIGQQQFRFKHGYSQYITRVRHYATDAWVHPEGPLQVIYYTCAFYDTDTKTWYHTANTNKHYYPEGMAKRVSDSMFQGLLRYGFVGYHGRKLSGELK